MDNKNKEKLNGNESLEVDNTTHVENEESTITDKAQPKETVTDEASQSEKSGEEALIDTSDLDPLDDESGKDNKAKKRRKRSFRKTMVYFAIIALASILISLVLCIGLNDIYAFVKNDKEISIYIEKGSTTKQIASALKKNDVIDFALLFRLYSRSNGADGTYQYGKYTLNSKMSYAEIIAALKKVAPKTDVQTVTVPEGFTLSQIAALLKEKGIISDMTDFLNYVNTHEFGFDFESKIKDDPNRFYKYEGYFYPNTYEFYLDDSYENIVRKFFSTFQRSLDSEVLDEISARGMTLDQALTLASIIQSEATTLESMGMVSSVFNNRLNNPSVYPNLQSDVTIIYVEENIKPYISEPNQAMYDAYNTYKCTGIPVAPVCNPSKQALRAAVFPDNTSYYYFITDKNGKYYYARTLAQHNANIAKSEKVR